MKPSALHDDDNEYKLKKNMSYEEQNIYNRKHPAEISGSLIVQ
jgi:hypothetical protein